jgi:hypothetical protein
MKKRVLAFTLLAFSIMAVVMSNSEGAARVSGLNLTGSDGGTVGCGGTGCHNGGQYTNDSMTPQLFITDAFGNPAGGFMPGQVYIINLKGTSDAPKWGYQISVSWTYQGMLYPSGLLNAGNQNAHDTFINGYPVVENVYPLQVVNDTIRAVAYWTAPYQSAIDTVNFRFTILNINDDSTADGDNSNSYVRQVHHWTTSATQLNADMSINAYPNPCTDRLNIDINNADAGLYSIKVYDAHGRLVTDRMAPITGSYQASLNTGGWAAGLYHVILNCDGKQKAIAVVKQ